MIKKSKQNIGLRDFASRALFLDSTENADYTFQVYDFPNRFYLGKNSFKILANTEFLANDAPILIDIEDKAGNPIFYEVTTLINRDRSRTIVVYIYEDIPIGNCTIYIASKVKKNPLTNESLPLDDLDSPNVIWKKEVLISTSQVSSEPIVFSNPPIIYFKERLEQKRIFQGTGSRFSTLTNRGSSDISLLPGNTSFELGVYRGIRDIDLSANLLEVIPTFESGLGRVVSPIRIPQYIPGSILKSRLFPFTSSMEGGTLVVRNIDISSSAPSFIANSLPAPDYSASIIRIINNSTAEVYPPFNYNTTYAQDGVLRTLSFNSFNGETNFTASWMNPLSASLGPTQSFLQIEMQNIQPTAGNVNSVRIRYKEVGGFGSYYDLGKYEIGKQELLIDAASVEFLQSGISTKRIGFPSPGDDVGNWWKINAVNVASPTIAQSDRAIQNSIIISHAGIPDSSSYLELSLASAYEIPVVKDSQYNLKFLASSTTSGSFSVPQIDIYVSGSEILTENVINVRNRLEEVSTAGSYLGSMRMQSGSFSEFQCNFVVLEEDKRISPIIVVRDGRWAVGQISLESKQERGFTPNQAKLNIPLPVLPAGQELLFEVQYLNDKDEPSELVQRFSGLYFRGSDPEGAQSISDLFDENLEYRDSGSWNRLILKNPGEFQLSYTSSDGESSTIQYITQSQFSTIGAGFTDIRFPIFRDNINNSSYTGSSSVVGLNFHVETVVFGKTGSFNSVLDSNVWSSTIQGRAIVTNFDNSGQPLLFNSIAFSGSGERSLGTFGSGSVNPKKNLDSWYNVNFTLVSGDTLRIRHRLAPTASFPWDFYLTSTCRVNKFDYRI